MDLFSTYIRKIKNQIIKGGKWFMNIHIYRQADSRWARLPYPGRGYTFGPNGCGACAVLHCIIEMNKYKNWTPKDIQPYMKQFATYGSGTTWAGIQKALVHYGLKDVTNVPTMPQLWRELAKGDRVGVLLFGSTHGPDGTVWTAGGHYIAFTGYRIKNGQHQLYLKDSGGRKHDGWYSYEKSMRGDVRQVWVGRLPKGSEVTGTPTTSKTTVNGKLTVDGIGGAATVKAMQKFFNVSQDGIISGQNKNYSKYYPALKSVKYGSGGSACVKKMQKWLNIKQDGIWGASTSKALQKKLGLKQDGIFGAASMKAWQKYLNKNSKMTYSSTNLAAAAPQINIFGLFKSLLNTVNQTSSASAAKTLNQKLFEACIAQAVWMRNATYKWESNPTVAKSKKRGTCVTYVACVLQRIGILKPGEFIWHTGRGYGNGKVYGTNSKMTVMYMGNKTLASLKSKLRSGDIVLLDDNKSGQRGGGGHIFILTGTWSGNNPYIWDNETAKKGRKSRVYNGSRKVLAIVRLKGMVTPKTTPATKPTTPWQDRANTWAITNTQKNKYSNVSWVFSIWRLGGGIPCRYSSDVITKSIADKILRSNAQTALALAKQQLGITYLQVISGGGKAIPLSQLKKGDICLLYKANGYSHIIYYMGDGKYSDSIPSRSPSTRANLTLAESTKSEIKLALRFTGK